jgi:hypothetical protein
MFSEVRMQRVKTFCYNHLGKVATAKEEMHCGAAARPFRLGLLIAIGVLTASACAGAVSSGGEWAEKQPSMTAAAGPTFEYVPVGEYTTKNFEPTLSFTVGEGWQFGVPDLRYIVDIGQGMSSGIAFMNIRYVYDANNPVGSEPKPAPDDLVAWLQQHSYLDTEKALPVTIGGVEGRQFDVTVSKVPTGSPPACGGPCLPLFELVPGLSFALAEDEKDRFIVVEGVEGKTVTIAAGAPDEEFEEFLPKAQKVLKTVQWEGI